MNVLLIGAGGREHALAWKLTQSPNLRKLLIAPGNAGTALHGRNIPLAVTETDSLLALARTEQIDLVVIGPELPIALGLADALRAQGIAVFAPSAAAAQLETSKAYAKDFMARHQLPTARYQTFQEFSAAWDYCQSLPALPVIKADGLAEGKGVLLPNSPAEAEQALREILLEGKFGAAGKRVVIEERLQGEEVSLLAFCDGKIAVPMPPAQDHKRVGDGDSGLNTGGMGAYAPTPLCPPAMVEKLTREILQPALDGLASEGQPFIGILYAGLMLSADGAKLLEFNCRFGDPETQVLLPLLESDLLQVLWACAHGKLSETQVRWKAGSAACVVLAAPGYPAQYPKGLPIRGLECAIGTHSYPFQAGTTVQNGLLVSNGGRVIAVSAWADELATALKYAYRAIEEIRFDGMHFRRDIGARALRQMQKNQSAYAASGVDIDAGNRAVELLKAAVHSTHGKEVLAGVGAFGGLYSASALQALQSPVLVASTDGVGTKVKLAAQLGQYASIGQDIVNHCANDILVQGARPLFFLDYIASAKLRPEMVAEIVGGMASACRALGCALLGGETAEMPGVYAPGEFDVAGTIVGVVEKSKLLPRADVVAGDVLVGLASSGAHTNGYSLIRKLVAGVDLSQRLPDGQTIAQALLQPHRAYAPLLQPYLDKAGKDSPIKALAHITGGGFPDNLPRCLPAHLQARVDYRSWQAPALFQWLQAQGEIASAEMYRVFNMGIGMVVVLGAADVAAFQASLPESSWVIGEVTSRE